MVSSSILAVERRSQQMRHNHVYDVQASANKDKLKPPEVTHLVRE